MGQKVVVTVEFLGKAKDLTNYQVGIYGENCEAMISACHNVPEWNFLLQPTFAWLCNSTLTGKC